jgi:hypothetical protein
LTRAERSLVTAQSDAERVLGRDDPATLETRNCVALCTRQVGKVRKAIRLFRELLSDQRRVLGRDQVDTLHTLRCLGTFTIESGDDAHGRQILREGLELAVKRYGVDHYEARQFRSEMAAKGCDGK